MSWIKWAKICHPFPLVYIFNTRIKLCHLKIYFLYIFLYLLQVVDNTFITYWRTHLPVHVAFKLELCCFPFELVPPHVSISKDAVLLIITEWPTIMPSLTSLTFHFPTSHEPKRWSFFFSIHVPSVNLKRRVSVSLFLTFPTDMDKIPLVFPLYKQLWPWTKQHVLMNCIFNP